MPETICRYPSIKSKSWKVQMYYFHNLVLLQEQHIIRMPNSMKFEPLVSSYCDFYILRGLKIVLKYLHAEVTFYTNLMDISSDEIVTMT